MEDWEKDDFELEIPKVLNGKLKSKWEDEDVDVEEDGVKDSWEDEDEPQESKPQPPHVEKKSSKPDGKAAQKLKNGNDKKTGSKVSAAESGVLADPIAEKLRLQRIEEEADYQSTKELFGRKNVDKTLDNFIPKSEKDFSEYADLISHALRPYEKSFHYVGLLKATMRLSMTALKASDAKDVASSISAIANEKVKAEKEANAGKKKGSKKKQLHVGKQDDDVDSHGTYEALDDYDFM